MAKNFNSAPLLPNDTPMMRQYLRIKSQFPDTLLFFRMGDFFEMFGEDALRAAPILGIAITSRNKGPDAIPMAGVPHHSADTYLAKLIKAGQKVAICEQLEDPALAKGVVKRDVVRVITPGTVYEENIVPADENIFLAAVDLKETCCAIAICDLSTGEFAVDTCAPDRLIAEMNRLHPREVLVRKTASALTELLRRDFAGIEESVIEQIEDERYESQDGAARLAELFHLDLSELFSRHWLTAAVALLSYLEKTQRGNLGQFRTLRDNALADSLAIDARSLRNLEVLSSSSGKRSASLLGVCDFTSTPMGARALRRWLSQPLTDLSAILFRQRCVHALLDAVELRTAIVKNIKAMCDLERVTARAAANRANPRDIGSLRDSLSLIRDLCRITENTEEPLNSFSKVMDPLDELRDTIANTIVDTPPNAIGDGEFVRRGVNSELDELRDIRKGGRNWIAEYQRFEIKRSGIPSLKVGYNTVFGYYIEVTKANLDNVPTDYIRKQTLVNCERFITPELKEYEARILSAEEKILAIENRIFRDIREQCASKAEILYKNAEAVATLDVLVGFSRLAEERRYCIPIVDDSTDIHIKDGRHPVVEAMLASGAFVPNDTSITPQSLIHIITGPNMAGKSTYIRQVAQIVILAQCGAPVPANEARIGIVDRLLTRIGAGDDLSRGRSTFMVEMLETAEILSTATPRSLIILDEVGRGTSTFDGLSLAWAVSEYIAQNRACSARTLFATHYHELTELAKICPNVANYNVLVREWKGSVVFLHRIERGFTDRSYGIHVAKLAGLPEKVVKRASDILRTLEKQSLDIEGKPRNMALKGARKQSEVQLLLFESPYDNVLNTLRSADLDKMTPLDALQMLVNLKKELD